MKDFNQAAFEALAGQSLYAISHINLPIKNEYDIVVKDLNIIDENGNPVNDYGYFDDLSLCQYLYWIVYSELKDFFEIEDCLNYQFDQCPDKIYFLRFTKTMFIDFNNRFRNPFESVPKRINFEKNKFIMRWFDNAQKQFTDTSFLSNLKFKGSPGDFIELITALHENGNIERADKQNLTRKDLLRQFRQFLNIVETNGFDDQNLSRRLSERTKIQERNLFLEQLKKAFQIYSKEKNA